MDLNFSGFGDFEANLEEIEVKKIGKHERMFKFGFGGSIACEPLIYGNNIIFAAMDGFVYCIDKTTSETIWTFKTGGSIHFAPFVQNERIVVGSFDGYIYCLSLDGKLLWRFKTGAEIAGSGGSDGKNIYIGSRDGHLYALNPENGSEAWRVKTGDVLVSSITICNDKIIFGSFDGNLYCVNSDGKELWRFKTGAEINCRFSYPVSENKIFFPSFDNFLYCVDIESGREVWRFKTGKYGSTGSPTLYKGVIYHGSRDGFFYAIDAKDGKDIWKIIISESDNPISTKPLVIDDKIYFGTDDEKVYCLNLDGNILWRFKTGHKIGCPPVFDNGNIYIGSFDCYLYSLDSRKGTEIWRYATSVSSPSYCPPAQEAFRIEVKKSENIEDLVESEDKYAFSSETLNFSDYDAKSEYAGKSEYTQKSEYTTDFVIFEGAMHGEQIWNSNLGIHRILK